MRFAIRCLLLAIPLLILSASASQALEKAAKTPQAEPVFSDWRNKPQEVFTKGSETFELVKKELLKNYYDQGLTEADLYKAAVQGMLTHADPAMKNWNALLSPTEFKELTADIKGKIVGVGIEIAFNETTGYADVMGVIPGTPAAKAGITRGDQILRIDGKSFRGKQLRDIVYSIRGNAGSEVKISLLHDEQIKTVQFKREALVWDSVKSRMLGDGIGFISIRNFTEETPASLRKALAALESQGMKSLALDLRGNEGGIFESSVESIKIFIPKGKTLVKMIKRGAVAETIVAKDDAQLKPIPIVVVIDGTTSSGAEIMAAALKMSAGATTVGTHTFGKWSAQRVDELPNSFAIKYTIATFLPPDGVDLTGKGLSPDITVAMDEGVAQKLKNETNVEVLLQSDTQLQAAVNVLKLRQASR